jgi:glucose/arabinose dehydrogenase
VPAELLATIIRIDPLGVTDGQAYAIPDDNPFVEGGGAPEVWLYGVRNPWRFSFDRANGNLWIGDVGQNEIEEIDVLLASDGQGAGAGANLGWSDMEGSDPYEGGSEPDDHTGPVYEYANDDNRCSVTGGVVYRGTAIPELDGTYLWADFCESSVRYLTIDADGALLSEGSLGLELEDFNISSFGQDNDGEVYVLALSEGKVYRIDPA